MKHTLECSDFTPVIYLYCWQTIRVQITPVTIAPTFKKSLWGQWCLVGDLLVNEYMKRKSNKFAKQQQ